MYKLSQPFELYNCLFDMAWIIDCISTVSNIKKSVWNMFKHHIFSDCVFHKAWVMDFVSLVNIKTSLYAKISLWTEVVLRIVFFPQSLNYTFSINCDLYSRICVSMFAHRSCFAHWFFKRLELYILHQMWSVFTKMFAKINMLLRWLLSYN